MNNARARFWIAFSLSGALWLAMMLLGGSHSLYDAQLYHDFYIGGHVVLARNSVIFTRIGSAWVLVPLAIAVAVYLILTRKRRAALFLIMVFGGRLLVEIQKLVVGRVRPDVSPHLIAVGGNSFPSAHAANAMITFLAIALLVPVRQRNRAIAVGIGLALALQVGASRVMLGVHWPSDIVGGWAFGIFWITVCLRLASARPDTEDVNEAR